MVIQYKAVLKITFFAIFLINAVFKSQQLALPKNCILTNETPGIRSIYFLQRFPLGLSESIYTQTAFLFSEVPILVNSEKMLGNIKDNLSYSYGNFNKNEKSKSPKDVLVAYVNNSYTRDDNNRIIEILLYREAEITSLENFITVIERIVLKNILNNITVGKNYVKFNA